MELMFERRNRWVDFSIATLDPRSQKTNTVDFRYIAAIYIADWAGFSLHGPSRTQLVLFYQTSCGERFDAILFRSSNAMKNPQLRIGTTRTSVPKDFPLVANMLTRSSPG